MVLRDILVKSVIPSIDNILMYSPTIESRIGHALFSQLMMRISKENSSHCMVYSTHTGRPLFSGICKLLQAIYEEF